MPSHAVLDAFVATVVAGRHDEAIDRFYAEDATMQENLAPPRRGRGLLVAQERKTMSRFKEIRTTCVPPVLVEGDVAVVRWVFEFVKADRSTVRMEELAWQRWAGDKIAEERFYYDPAQTAALRG
ncbi:MAG TPA: nuclear transport factor 2 family protein [Rhizomicrobium sp.]|nr:nuclear transport factor 2 family protein [Rhizomicrobium sp.]